MKKYVLVRLSLVFVNVFLVGSLLFFALTLSTFKKWTMLPFDDYMRITSRLYKVFLKERILHSNWGLTISGDPVKEFIVPRFWVSLKYNIIALMVYFPIGITLGMLSAYYKGSFFDHIVNTIALVLGSIPIYILSFLLIIILGFQLQIFPPHISEIPGTFFGSIWGLGIPIIALSAGAITRISRVIRSEIIETLQSDSYLLAKTKGLTKKQIFTRHILKRSIASLLPVSVEVFMIVLMGSFFVEMSFGIEGVAEQLYKGLIGLYEDLGFNYIQIDVNLIVVIAVFYMIVGSLFALFIDLLYPILDPRMNIIGRIKKQ